MKEEKWKERKRKEGKKASQKVDLQCMILHLKFLFRYSAPLMLSIVFKKVPATFKVAPVLCLKLLYESHNPKTDFYFCSTTQYFKQRNFLKQF